MKRVLPVVLAIAALSGCNTMSRNPASQDSPEIQQKLKAELEASPLLVGDRLVFNEESRFDVGSNKLRLGVSSSYPTSASCSLVVEPPRGERVQNYVPAGKVLTIVGIRAVQKGHVGVTLRGYSVSRKAVQDMVTALNQRGYDTSKVSVESSKSLYRDVPALSSIIAYDLSGSTLKSSLECEIYSDRSGVTVYDGKDFAKLDEANLAIHRPVTVGEMFIITGGNRFYYNEKPAVTFEPARRSETEYKKIPINFFVPTRTFDDVRQNSI